MTAEERSAEIESLRRQQRLSANSGSASALPTTAWPYCWPSPADQNRDHRQRSAANDDVHRDDLHLSGIVLILAGRQIALLSSLSR